MIALGGYTLLSFAPVLGFIRIAKIAENSADYSIQNTARHALFLRTDREAKYKGKTTIDGFFWRAGDAVSAAIVFVGTSLAFDIRGFARTNAILTAAWLCVVAGIVWFRASEGEPESEGAQSMFGRFAEGRRVVSNSAAGPIRFYTAGSAENPGPDLPEVSWP